MQCKATCGFTDSAKSSVVWVGPDDILMTNALHKHGLKMFASLYSRMSKR
jgi:hypothetical protein